MPRGPNSTSAYSGTSCSSALLVMGFERDSKLGNGQMRGPL